MPHLRAFVLALIFHVYCLGMAFVYGMFIKDTTLLCAGWVMMFWSIALDRRGVLHFNRDTT
jgi:hypothetical protein